MQRLVELCGAGRTGLFFCLLLTASGGISSAAEPFRIRIVDDQTGRGVPLVEFETVNQIRLVSDSNGLIAFDEPGLLGTRVFFHVRSHGYEFPADAFGYRGAALETKPGGSAELKIRRINIAERLYRMTGAGIYRDSVLLGEEVPTEQPLLNGKVLGSDSVVNAEYRGKIYWFWGDTNRPGYPLGNFHVPGATSKLPSRGGLDPDRGVNLRYFVDETGFAKPTAKMPGEGPTWIDGLVTVKSASGDEQMFAAYVKIKPPLTVYERGLIRWNDAAEQFEHVMTFPEDAVLYPRGHTFKRTEGDVEYVYFCDPFPFVRVPATPQALADLSRYEAFTCLEPGSKDRVERTSDGAVRHAWKANTPPVGPAEQKELIEAGELQPHEGLIQFRDRDTGKPVFAHRGSVCWNEHRQRWVMIATEQFGSSLLGEVWYSEADTPVGPWAYAVKVVTHDNYSFYNPKQHPMFDKDGGRTIFFEGTYTHSFSGNPDQTPRYDYNQIMYKLDLTDPRTALPLPLSRTEGGSLQFRAAAEPADWNKMAFFAFDREAEGTVPVYGRESEGGGIRLSAGNGEGGALFHALPAEIDSPPASAVPLYEFVREADGRRKYTTNNDWSGEGFKRAESPVCLVWQNPWRAPKGTNAESTR